MEPKDLQSKRGWIGLLSLVCLIGFGLLMVMNPEKQAIAGSMMRIGIMLGAFWLAIPVLVSHPRLLKRLPWYVLGIGFLLLMFIKQFWMLIPLLIVLALLSMFGGSRPRS